MIARKGLLLMTKKLSYKANHAKQMSYNLVSYYQEELYRDEILSLQILLSRTQSGPGRTDKQEQEEISPNHVQRLNLISVLLYEQFLIS